MGSSVSMYYFLLLLPVCLLVLWAKILADLRLTQRLLFRLLQGQLTPSELRGYRLASP